MAYIPCLVVVLSRTSNDVLSRGNYTRKGSARFYLTSKPVKLEHLISINGAVLTVYYVGDRYYQYEILFWDGSIFQPLEMYESADKALDMGLESIKITIGYQ